MSCSVDFVAEELIESLSEARYSSSHFWDASESPRCYKAEIELNPNKRAVPASCRSSKSVNSLIK